MKVLNERHAVIIIHPHRPTPDHILYGSDYPYLPDAVLKANLQKLKQTLASDKELAEYADLFLRKNAERLFTADAAPGNIPTESSPPAS